MAKDETWLEKTDTPIYDNASEIKGEEDEITPEDLMETATLRERLKIATMLLDEGNLQAVKKILKG